jgi:hypothetical protein
VTAESGVRTSYMDTAALLADRVLGVLLDGGAVDLAGFVDSFANRAAALAAVRLVGADVFAPHALSNRPPGDHDAAVIHESCVAFPPICRPVTWEQRVTAWRDWATRRMLARVTQPDGTLPDATAPGEPADVLGPPEDWQRWSGCVAQLSTLALPGAGDPVARAVGDARLALAKGATRAVLRRDYGTAARLARWVALLCGAGARRPLDPARLIEHLRLQAGAEPRLLLHLAIASQLLEVESVVPVADQHGA